VPGPACSEEVLRGGLSHQSDWILSLTAHLIVQQCSEPDRRLFAEFALGLADSSLYAGAEIAASLPPEEALALILKSLDRPVKEGFEHLLMKLSQLPPPYSSAIPEKVIEAALFCSHAEVAQSATRFLSRSGNVNSHITVALIRRAITHWLKNEHPYPTMGGLIPPSPRPELLRLLISKNGMPNAATLVSARDQRPEIRKIALRFLLEESSKNKNLVSEIIEKTLSAQLDVGVLRFLLQQAIVLDAVQLNAVIEALRHSDASIRHAALPLLQNRSLQPDLRQRLASEFSTSGDDQIRQAAYQIMDDL